jgi:hypothetical protein
MKSEVWLYPGMAGWHFLPIPKKHGEEIKKRLKSKAKGWRSLPVLVTIGKTKGILSGDKVIFSIEIQT